ncbi:MAG TPA: hypothetical protein PLM98_18125, partial [Thiolinea sp.]|nr:hypothetical protein [Thiolinea sp.]
MYAEVEDVDWVTNLSEKEVELAARYAVMERGNLPFWLEDLAIKHADTVDRTLGQELSWALDQDVSEQSYFILLHGISDASDSVVKIFLPRLRLWLDSTQHIKVETVSLPKIAERLRLVINVLMKHGSAEELAYLINIAQHRLNQEPPKELVFIWLATLMQLAPELAVPALENRLKTLEPAKCSEAITWFSLLFGDRSESISLANPVFTPQLLLRLLRLAYFHVRRNDDNEHEGVFRPNARDRAERARDGILTTLLNSKGEGGWIAKLEIADDPLFVHLKDRILAIAEENWSQEIDSEVFDDKQVVTLDKLGEAPPSTNSAMFALLKDRLSDLDDLLLTDVSPREAWAGIKNERVMRREIARELKNSANGLYA